MDLRTPLVPEDRLHANFRALAVPGHFDDEWNTLHTWAEGFVDRDGKFVKEFQTTFNSSFWELYLHAAFRDLGYQADYSHSRPDFVLQHDLAGSVVAEAVIASHADGYCPEWRHSFDQLENVNLDEIVHIATIRLANAIWSKYKKFKESYAQLTHMQGKPFIICAAPFEQPTFFVQNDNALRRVLYGFDQPLWLPTPNGGRLPVGESSLPEIFKDNGTAIPLGFFASPMMPEVSAVVFSNTATTTKVRALTRDGRAPVIFTAVRYNAQGTEPRFISAMRPEFSETLLDGLHVCINPFAIEPMDLAPFEGREVTIHHYDPASDEYHPLAPDGFLIQHGSILLTSGREASVFEAIAEDEYKRPQLPVRRERELFPVAGHVGPFVDNHLAHHRGWTICVARDIEDDDWSAQATLGTHQTLAAYHQADKSSLILAQKWYNTKEEAFEQILKVLERHLNQPTLEARRAVHAKAKQPRQKRELRKRRKAERQRRKKSGNR